MIFGNTNTQSALRSFLQPEAPIQTIILSGPESAGKHHLIQELAKAVSADDVLLVEPGVESARDAVGFCSTNPIEEPVRILFLPDLDKFTDPAQDAYLKLVEEPPASLKVVATSSNPVGIQPALLSRFRHRLNWSRLSDDDMRAFASSEGVVDDFALSVSNGLPGVYFRLSHQSKFRDLAGILESIAVGNHAGILAKVPDIISKLDSKSEDRVPVIHLVRRFARTADKSRAKCMFDYASVLTSVPSANSEIHWMRMIAAIT